MRKMLIPIAAALIAGCGDVPAKPPARAASEPTVVSTSVPAGWTEDFAAAKAAAAKTGKKILVAFSGSDWCHWCVKLDEETFSKKAFVELASATYELVLIDLPSDMSKLSELGRKQNQELADRFGVSGFPHGIVLASDGTELGRIGGYIPGGPAAYFKAMENCRPGPVRK